MTAENTPEPDGVTTPEGEAPGGESQDGGENAEPTVADLQAEVAKWKSLSQKTEKQAKANDQAVKDLEQLKRTQLTDQERLVESAKDETRLAVRVEFAGKIVDAEFKSSLAGRSLDGSALLDFDKGSFITDSGEVDSEAITAWVDAHSTKTALTSPDMGQGTRGANSDLSQISSRDEFKNMSPEQILEAHNSGRLDKMMGK
jgi:hypothetical protein